MSPLYPLRVIILSLASWAILGGAVLCLWTWVDRTFNDHEEVAVAIQPIELADPSGKVDRNDDAQQLPLTETIVLDDRRKFAEDVPTWIFLVSGFVLTLFSFGGGFFPARLIFGKGKSESFTPVRNEPLTIVRPDGSQLYVQIFGDSSLPTLIFTHGWSLDNTDWHYAKKQLGSKFRLVVWDLPGLGRSTVADDKNQSLEKMAHDLDAVVERTSEGRSIYLLGHSIGGMISQVYARLYSKKLGNEIKGIVLVNTTYKNPLTTILGAPLFTAIQWPVLVPLNYLVILLAPFFWLSNWKSYLNGSLQTSSRYSSFTGSQTWSQLDHAALLSAKAWPAVVARGNYAMTQFDEEDSLPKIKIPVLIIAGEHDRITKKCASERIHQLVPNSELAVLPGGHQQLYEFHERVMSRIALFLTNLEKEKSQKIPVATTKH